jgi:hypothetical protein
MRIGDLFDAWKSDMDPLCNTGNGDADRAESHGLGFLLV